MVRVFVIPIPAYILARFAAGFEPVFAWAVAVKVYGLVVAIIEDDVACAMIKGDRIGACLLREASSGPSA